MDRKIDFRLAICATIAILLSIGVLAGSKTVLAKSSCTILTKDLSYSATNSGSGSQVSVLQDFLYAGGYLSTAATGRYGTLTVAAVKKFQASQSISQTGTAGPLTRAAIQKISCPATAVNATIQNVRQNTSVTPLPVSYTASVISAVQSPPVQTYLITSPSAGTPLTIGQKYQIQWSGNNNKSDLISILLKDNNGAGAGFVAGSLPSLTNNYVWTVGNISIGGNQAAVVPPGNYQLSVVDNTTFGSIFKVNSGIFTLVAAPLFITHILPSQVAADNKSTVLLYGSGYNSQTRISLVGPYSMTLFPQFVSNDGNFIWFYVPQYVTPGQYQISVYNDYSTADNSATSSPSNSASLQVNQAVL